MLPSKSETRPPQSSRDNSAVSGRFSFPSILKGPAGLEKGEYTMRNANTKLIGITIAIAVVAVNASEEVLGPVPVVI
jgi:hypothetical protein